MNVESGKAVRGRDVTSVRGEPRKYKRGRRGAARYYTGQECGESVYYAVIKGACE